MAATTTDQPPVKPPATPTDCTAVNGYNWNSRTAYAICMAESRGNPDATGYNQNGTADRGLMQVNSIHADMVGGNLASLYDPATNIKIAYSLSKGGTDWTAWSTYNNGAYRQWL
ncbi:MAG: transglycosylase SLT domain-containing protein [Pseudomonadota bacterium]